MIMSLARDGLCRTQLLRRGAQPIWMPTIATEPYHDTSELDLAVERLSAPVRSRFRFLAPLQARGSRRVGAIP